MKFASILRFKPDHIVHSSKVEFTVDKRSLGESPVIFPEVKPLLPPISV